MLRCAIAGDWMKTDLPYLRTYPESLQDQARQLLVEGRLEPTSAALRRVFLDRGAAEVALSMMGEGSLPRDADVLTAAFREFSKKKLDKERKPSVRRDLAEKKAEAAQTAKRDKVKNMDRGIDR